MQKFTYTIKDEEGLHARPAGLLVKCAQKCSSKVTIECKGHSADAKRLFAVMGLGAGKNDQLAFSIEGPKEDTDCATLKDFCTAHL
jgi:phosphotransferase system HPr (HPr) family protein